MIRECEMKSAWLFILRTSLQWHIGFQRPDSLFSGSGGLSGGLSWGITESSCSEVGCLWLQVLQVFLPLHSLYVWPHSRQPHHSALSWANFFRWKRGIFENFIHISSSWLSLQNGQTIHLLLLELGLLLLTVSPFSSDEAVAKALKQEFPLTKLTDMLHIYISVLWNICKISVTNICHISATDRNLASFSYLPQICNRARWYRSVQIISATDMQVE